MSVKNIRQHNHTDSIQINLTPPSRIQLTDVIKFLCDLKILWKLPATFSSIHFNFISIKSENFSTKGLMNVYFNGEIMSKSTSKGAVIVKFGSAT